MFPEFPKLFGKPFIIGFFLPSAILVFGVISVLKAFDIESQILSISKKPADMATTIFVVWLASILLLALNRSLIRILEGYVYCIPFTWLKTLRSNLFKKKAQPLFDLAKKIDMARAEGRDLPETPDDFAEKLSKIVQNFPDQDSFVLPTSFGNRMRAFEVYPRVIYGIDAIPAWPRLLMVLPAEVRQQLQEGRALLDFAVNIVWSSAFVLLLYLIFVLSHWSIPSVWIACVYLTTGTLSWYLMGLGAKQWGEQVKSVFDLYRSTLAEKLGFETPRNPDFEFEMWQNISKMMIYRSRSRYQDLLPRKPL